MNRTMPLHKEASKNPQVLKATSGSHSAPPEKIFDYIYKKFFRGTNQEGIGNQGPGLCRRCDINLSNVFAKISQSKKYSFCGGCGMRRLRFSQAMDWTGIQYKGFDIVEDVIKENISKYSAPNISEVSNVVEGMLQPTSSS